MTEIDPQAEVKLVVELNRKFYAAHEQRSFDLMESIWHHGEGVMCIHPGWPILRGWEAIADSWRRILNGPGQNQFIITNEHVVLHGTMAWITLDENMMSPQGTGTVAATNLFRRINGQWKMVHHHGSPIASRPKSSKREPDEG